MSGLWRIDGGYGGYICRQGIPCLSPYAIADKNTHRDETIQVAQCSTVGNAGESPVLRVGDGAPLPHKLHGLNLPVAQAQLAQTLRRVGIFAERYCELIRGGLELRLRQVLSTAELRHTRRAAAPLLDDAGIVEASLIRHLASFSGFRYNAARHSVHIYHDLRNEK